MTIAEIVSQCGLPVKVMMKGRDLVSYPAFTVHTAVSGGWLVDYIGHKNHFISDEPHLKDYVIAPTTQ